MFSWKFPSKKPDVCLKRFFLLLRADGAKTTKIDLITSEILEIIFFFIISWLLARASRFNWPKLIRRIIGHDFFYKSYFNVWNPLKFVLNCLTYSTLYVQWFSCSLTESSLVKYFRYITSTSPDINMYLKLYLFLF